MILEWYVGFHRPWLRDLDSGRISIRGLLGHCEIWGYSPDGTWLFIDPSAHGPKVRVTHHFEEVQRHLAFRFELCSLILKVPADDPDFRLPLRGPMSCATFCGALTGVRALLPSTLRRRLLAKGAEVVHGEAAERRSGR